MVASKFLLSRRAFFTSFCGMIYFLAEPIALHHIAEAAVCVGAPLLLDQAHFEQQYIVTFALASKFCGEKPNTKSASMQKL